MLADGVDVSGAERAHRRRRQRPLGDRRLSQYDGARYPPGPALRPGVMAARLALDEVVGVRVPGPQLWLATFRARWRSQRFHSSSPPPHRPMSFPRATAPTWASGKAPSSSPRVGMPLRSPLAGAGPPPTRPRAHITRSGVVADFGGLGRIDLDFEPSGRPLEQKPSPLLPWGPAADLGRGLHRHRRVSRALRLPAVPRPVLVQGAASRTRPA